MTTMRGILGDRAFWKEIRGIMIAAVEPEFRAAFLDGARAGLAEISATKADVDEDPLTPWIAYIDDVADGYVDTYTNQWWDKMEATRRTALRKAIDQAKKNGLGWKFVADRIKSLFDPDKAKAVAITELTNVMGAGAQAMYRASGFEQWQWRTAVDARVDPICEARAEQVYPISTEFSAAHPGCRCWPVPHGEPSTIPFELGGTA